MAGNIPLKARLARHNTRHGAIVSIHFAQDDPLVGRPPAKLPRRLSRPLNSGHDPAGAYCIGSFGAPFGRCHDLILPFPPAQDRSFACAC